MEKNVIEIELNKWLYKGCFIEKFENSAFFENYQVYKNNEKQHMVGMCMTFAEARKLCEKNECFENYLKLKTTV